MCDKTENFCWKNFGGEKKYIDLASVSKNSFKIEDHKIIDNKNAHSRAKKVVRNDDVIFATTRPTLKRATIISSDYDNKICSTGFVVFRSTR